MQVPGAPGSLAWCQADILTHFIASRQVADWEARTHCNLYDFCWVAQVLFCQGKSFKQKVADSPCEDQLSSLAGMAMQPLEGRVMV